MRYGTSFTLGAAAIALAAGVAGAQDGGDGSADFESSVPYEQYLSDSDLRASELIGATVRNREGEELGEIDDLVVSRDDDVITAVINVGGFLGLAEKPIGVPYEEFRVSQDGESLFLEASLEELEALPGFEYDTRADEGAEAGAGDALSERRRERTDEAGEPAASRGPDRRDDQPEQAAADETPEDVETLDDQVHRASELIGAAIIDAQGEEVGSVDDIVVGEEQEPRAVLSLGGILGLGDTLVAVPLAELAIEREPSEEGDDAMRVRIDTTVEELIDSEPEFRYELTASADEPGV